jgi:hypothetical protein
VSFPTPSPAPSGPLARFLQDPAGFNRRVLEAATGWLSGILPSALVLLSLLCIAVTIGCLLGHFRERRLQRGGRRVRILLPPEVDPKGARTFWMGLHALLRPWWKRLAMGQPYISWEFVARPEEIELAVWVPSAVPPGLIERAIQAAWPGARTARGEDGFLKGRAAVAVELALAEPDWFPIGPGPDEEPLRLPLAALTGLEPGEEAIIQVIARPAISSRRRRLIRAARAVRTGIRPGLLTWRPQGGRSANRVRDPSSEGDIRSILIKAASPLFHSVVRVAVASRKGEAARGRIHSLAGAFAVFEGRNGFRRGQSARVHLRMQRRILGRSYLLSAPELAALATLPLQGSLPGLEEVGTRTVAPAKGVCSAGKVLGVADHAGICREVAIAVEDARHHLHMIGETGTGKSTLLAQMVLQDAAAKRAAVVIDPKGDLVEAILERLPEGAEGRTCVLDPEDPTNAVGLDVLKGEDHDLVVDHTLGVFKRIYEPWWGPRTDDIMRAACLTLKQIPGATLAEVPLLLTDFEWRRRITGRLSDVVGVSTFWSWYERLPESQRAQHIAPLLNKLRAFLLRGPVRAIVGQAAPKRDLESLVDEGGLLLVRIPKGTLGEDTSRLLGAFVIARVWQACMKRVARPESERPDATLYVDEMHNYLALPRSFEDLLAEARGYRLSLVLAHQHLSQLPRDMRDALAANARTKVVFACSPEDAQYLQRHFVPRLEAHDLSRLGAFQAACRPCLGGGQGHAFTLRTKPLPPGSSERAAAIRRASGKAFGRARSDVEDEIVQRHLSARERLLPPERPMGQPVGQSVGQSGGQSGDRP